MKNIIPENSVLEITPTNIKYTHKNEEINKNNPSKTFNKFFVNGQLRVDTLFPEEKALLAKFSEITGMEIKDMGELDLNKAEEVASEIEKLLETPEFKEEKEVEVEEATEEAGETKWLCPLCGYVHTGEEPPEKCPICGAPSDVFVKQ